MKQVSQNVLIGCCVANLEGKVLAWHSLHNDRYVTDLRASSFDLSLLLPKIWPAALSKLKSCPEGHVTERLDEESLPALLQTASIVHLELCKQPDIPVVLVAFESTTSRSNSVSGCVVVDALGFIVSCDESVLDVLETDLVGLVGKHIASLVHSSEASGFDLQTISDFSAQSLRDETLHTTLLNSSGSVLPVSVRFLPAGSVCVLRIEMEPASAPKARFASATPLADKVALLERVWGSLPVIIGGFNSHGDITLCVSLSLSLSLCLSFSLSLCLSASVNSFLP